MATSRREEHGRLLEGCEVKVHAVAFNSKWKHESERVKSGVAEYFNGVIQKYHYSSQSKKDRWDVDFDDGTCERCAKELLKKYFVGTWPILVRKKPATSRRTKSLSKSIPSDDDECISASDASSSDKSAGDEGPDRSEEDTDESDDSGKRKPSRAVYRYSTTSL